MRIDQTSHKLYIKCPRAWEMRYVKNLIMPPAAALYLGSTVHYSLAFLGQHKIEKETLPPLDVFLDHFTTAFDNKEAYADEEQEKFKDLPDIDWAEDKPGQVKDLGVNMLGVYYKRRALQLQPLQIEMKFEKVFNEDGDIFYGKIDRVDPDGICDYKTANPKALNLSFSKQNIELDIQPSAYAFGLGGPTKFSFEFLLKSIPADLGLRETERTQRDIDWYLDMLRQDVKAIKAGYFPCRPNWSCLSGWCAYRTAGCNFRL